MKKINTIGWILLLIFGCALLGVKPAFAAERVRKAHPGPQLIYNDAEINDVTDDTVGVSTTLDLDGGNYDKCSFQIQVTSGAVTTSGSTLDLDIQISADGGTTWAKSSVDAIPLISTYTVAVSCHTPEVAVSPGTHLRILPTVTADATWYSINVWALPTWR